MGRGGAGEASGRGQEPAAGALVGVPHEELALALAADTLRAVLACPAVAEALVVTNDARVAAAARPSGPGCCPTSRTPA
ncbi:hypothetical protein GCM10027614_65250 [Micromonospora vulcania]